MAEDYAQNNDADLLSLELGIDVDEDEFKKAEQQIDQLKDRMDDIDTSIDIKIPGISTVIDSLERAIQLVSELNKESLRISMDRTGGNLYNISNFAKSKIEALDRKNFVAQRVGISSEDVFSTLTAMNVTSDDIALGNLDNEQYVKMQRLGLLLGDKSLQNENLNKLFVDPNVNPLDRVIKIANAVMQGLMSEDAKTRVAALSLGKDYFSQGILEFLATSADLNKEKNTNEDYFSALLGLNTPIDLYLERSRKIVDNLITADAYANRLTEMKDSFVQDLGVASSEVTKNVFKAAAEFGISFWGTPLEKGAKKASSGGYYYGGSRSFNIPGARAEINKALHLGDNFQYRGTGEDIVADRALGVRKELIKVFDKDKSNDTEALENLLNIALATDRSPYVNELNYGILDYAIQKSNEKLGMPLDKAVDQYSGLYGTEVLDKMRDLGVFNGKDGKKDYESARTALLQQFNFQELVSYMNRASEVNLPVSERDYKIKFKADAFTVKFTGKLPDGTTVEGTGMVDSDLRNLEE